ncbi:MAG: helix-hairpin-helix domain-containing protein [Oscillospiraceae bacterium]|nr:helix-hairpin-helix domain-containing protein [Oscillospiraceae bacterium]
MKLSKAEIIIIVITVVFVSLAFISFLIDRDGRAAVTISTDITASAEASVSPSSAAPSPEISSVTLVNINTATAQELCSLPGIGETLSGRIVAYREEHGLFKSTDEIMSVEGIGAKTFENLKNNITVD